MIVGCVPLLMSEISPPHSRGLLVGMFGISVSIGYSLASWLAVAFYFCSNTAVQWRLPLAVTAVPSLILLALLPLVPESPRWLLMKGRNEEGARIVRKLHGSDLDPRLDEFANLEIQQMTAQIAFEQQNHIGWVEFLTSRKYARRVWIAAFTFMTSQVRYSPDTHL
jgi:MFS family permease